MSIFVRGNAQVARFGLRSFSQAARSRGAPAMFCMQCEQTENASGCTTVGVCGKTPDVANLQDLLVEKVKNMSLWADRARQENAPENTEANRFTTQALFACMTNVNFDKDRFVNHYIPKASEYTDLYKQEYLKACQANQKKPEFEDNQKTPVGSADDMLKEAEHAGVLARRGELGEEISGLQELVVYGLKGMSAYASHAAALGKESEQTYKFLQSALATLASNSASSKDFDSLLQLALGVGAENLNVLQMLDAGHTSNFGNPEPTVVARSPVPGKCILVSGHDLHDLHKLLKDTEGKGINVYTHGEMLPAHSYPELKKFSHLKGNYGGPWQLQKFEFAKFPGPIVMTTNCIIEPRKSYKDRIYTTNEVGFGGVQHLKQDANGDKDYSDVIAQALAMDGFTEANIKPTGLDDVTVGFGHHAVLQAAGTVVDAVRKGQIDHFYLIGGCDGNESERSYFRDLALASSPKSVILTLGCGKYRVNNLDLGLIPEVGLPRVLDMGQCNDSYGAVVVASELAKAFGTDVNGLPLSFAVSWFEQKAVAVLLTLLHLGVKNIVLGPNMPAFVGPKLGGMLNESLGLRPTDPKKVAEDIAKFTA